MINSFKKRLFLSAVTLSILLVTVYGVKLKAHNDNDDGFRVTEQDLNVAVMIFARR